MAIWNEVHGWRFEYFDIDATVRMADTFQRFRELWRTKRGDRNAPPWREFEFGELEEWWGRMSIMDIRHDPFDYCYRLWGTALTSLFDYDATGRCASDLRASEKYNVDDEFEFYRLQATKPTLSFTSGSVFWQDRSHRTFRFIELPLSDDSESVTNIISVLERPV
ncbi:MAG: hypothetical protein RIC16_06445 [Rhodospirillales bacterium]